MLKTLVLSSRKPSLQCNKWWEHVTFKTIGKLVVGCMLAVGCMSIPFIQDSMGTSITTQAKQIEALNKQIEEANEQYNNDIISHEEYEAIVTPLAGEIEKVVAEAKAIDPNFKIKVVRIEDSTNEQGDVVQSYEIIEEK